MKLGGLCSWLFAPKSSLAGKQGHIYNNIKSLSVHYICYLTLINSDNKQEERDMKVSTQRRRVDVDASGLRCAVVGARFNAELADSLVHHAVKTLRESGATISEDLIIRVPGSFEVPLVCKELLERDLVDLIVATGVIIRGETAHFDHLCADVISSLSKLALDYKTPIGFGVIMANTPEQAQERADESDANKGREAALAAIELRVVINSMGSSKG